MTTIIEISTHSGDIDVIEVENYNAQEVVEELNNNEVHAIAFGDNVYSRIDIKNIKKISDRIEESLE